MSFIAVPLKKSYEIDLVKPLKSCISTGSSQNNSASQNWDSAIENLNKLRSSCISKSLDPRHENSSELLEKYYDQINSLEQKCPAHELNISFKWRDAFDKGSSFLMSSNTLSVASLNYEKCCVLFNIAAIKSHIGAMLATEGVNNDVSLKLAAKNFQAASGIFLGLRYMTPSIGQDITPDLNPDVMNVIHNIMLAQAQELFFFKASNDNLRDLIVARVASQCEDYYMEALKHLPILKLAGIEKDWSSVVAMKQIAFAGIAEYHQALVCQENKDFGEQIARAQKAVDCLKSAEAKGGSYFMNIYRNFLTKASRLLEEAKKDNDFIYHARIPDIKSLTPIGKASLVQAIPLPTKFREDLSDPFENLLPIAVQQAVQKLEAKRQELVQQEISSLRESSNILNGILASLNLPASLEDFSSEELPLSIREKVDFVQSNGGIQKLERIITELPSLLKRNKEILEVTQDMLRKEEETDVNYRQQFKEKWTRSPSEKLNAIMKDHLTKYRNIIQNAMDADEKIKRKFNEHRDIICLLSESNYSQILNSIPSGSGSGSDQLDSPSAMQLKGLMNEIEILKKEREELEEEFKNVPIDEFKSKFQNQLLQNSSINEEALIMEVLATGYAPLQKRARENKSKQENMVEKVRRVNEQFVSTKRNSNSADSRRSQFLTKLATAHDAFKELMVNCAEGTKFYNDLTTLLVNLQGKVDDLCFARKTEAEELCKSIQNDIVSQPSPSPPTAPSYHGVSETTDSAKGAKPPRPPPPQVATVPATTAPPSYPYAQAPYPAQPPYHPYYYPPPPLPSSFSPFANPYTYQQPAPASFPNPYSNYSYPQQPTYPTQNPNPNN